MYPQEIRCDNFPQLIEVLGVGGCLKTASGGFSVSGG